MIIKHINETRKKFGKLKYRLGYRIWNKAQRPKTKYKLWVRKDKVISSNKHTFGDNSEESKTYNI